jgi:hypothetical protein
MTTSLPTKAGPLSALTVNAHGYWRHGQHYNSGAAQPSTTYAYQWWPDTTTGLLKLRNAANNAWITIGTLADANLGLDEPCRRTR